MSSITSHLFNLFCLVNDLTWETYADKLNVLKYYIIALHFCLISQSTQNLMSPKKHCKVGNCKWGQSKIKKGKLTSLPKGGHFFALFLEVSVALLRDSDNALSCLTATSWRFFFGRGNHFFLLDIFETKKLDVNELTRQLNIHRICAHSNRLYWKFMVVKALTYRNFTYSLVEWGFGR